MLGTPPSFKWAKTSKGSKQALADGTPAKGCKYNFCFIIYTDCRMRTDWILENKIHIEDVWKETYGNENIIVGIIDSGIDITSSDLQSVIYHNDQEISNNQVDDVVNAIKYGYNKGIRLFNCSWDMEVYSEKLYTIMKECSDAIFVCSGGKIVLM